MPIKAENRSKYPPPTDWAAIRQQRLERAGYRCEQCGVPHHAVGYRADGQFIAAAGREPLDAAGTGQAWPTDGLLQYAEARTIAHNLNYHEPTNAGIHWLVVVLTIAHLDHDPTHNADTNLQALCQQCHNHYDADHRQRNAALTRHRRQHATPSQGDLLTIGEYAECKKNQL